MLIADALRKKAASSSVTSYINQTFRDFRK
jgi:hypothetical protein